jgi:peptidyl-tRNA hydrolase, PTH1 family
MPDGDRRLVVGLRNPGDRYEGTRHNVGAAVVDILLSRHGAKLKRGRRSLRSEVAELSMHGHGVVMALPNTFVNNSGEAIGPLARYYDIDPAEVLIVYDDIDLPFAKLRVRFGGSAGGQNGIKSAIVGLGTQDFWRLKIGVGRPRGHTSPAAHVLARFPKNQREEIGVTIEHAADLAETFVTDGGDTARQRAGELNT